MHSPITTNSTPTSNLLCTSYPYYLFARNKPKVMLASIGGRLAQCIIIHSALRGHETVLSWVVSVSWHFEESRAHCRWKTCSHGSWTASSFSSKSSVWKCCPKLAHPTAQSLLYPWNNFTNDGKTLGNQVIKVLKQRGHCSCIFSASPQLRKMMLTIAHLALIYK